MKITSSQVSVVALKLGLVLAMVGCAASPASAESEANTDAMPEVETNMTAPADTISLNCGQTLPGFPPLPCKPELKLTNTITEIWAPGNPQNLAPGHYIHFNFVNDSEKAAGAFRVHVKDGAGNVVSTLDVPGLLPHQGASIVNVAPYACGWSRTAVLDVNGAVDEADETNNTASYQKRCVVLPAGTITTRP